MQLGVAQPGKGRADQHLAGPRLVDLDVLDGQRLVHLVQNGGFHRALLAFPLDLSLERLLRHCRLASNTPRCCRIVEATALAGSAAEVRRIKKKGQSPDRALRKRRTMSSRSWASRRCLRFSAETIVTSASSPLTLDGE